MSDQGERPKVGTGLMIFKDNKVLLFKRKGSHGAGEYSLAGGYVEYMESLEETVRREAREECGLEIKDLKFLAVFNLKKYAPKHHIGIGFTANWKSGEPRLLEPHRAESWNWYEVENLPQPLFEGSAIMFDALKTGRTFYDA